LNKKPSVVSVVEYVRAALVIQLVQPSLDFELGPEVRSVQPEVTAMGMTRHRLPEVPPVGSTASRTGSVERATNMLVALQWFTSSSEILARNFNFEFLAQTLKFEFLAHNLKFEFGREI